MLLNEVTNSCDEKYEQVKKWQSKNCFTHLSAQEYVRPNYSNRGLYKGPAGIYAYDLDIKIANAGSDCKKFSKKLVT